MSYSYTAPCHGCAKQPTCSDSNIIAGAIQTIHSLQDSNGHRGAGHIEHSCHNHEETVEEGTPS